MFIAIKIEYFAMETAKLLDEARKTQIMLDYKSF